MFGIDVLPGISARKGRAMAGFGNLDSVVLLFAVGLWKLMWRLDFPKCRLSPGAFLILWDVGPLRRDHSELLCSGLCVIPGSVVCS